MNRNQENQDFRREREANRRGGDEDQYRGAYRLDNTRGEEYNQLDHLNNFNDNNIRHDYRSRNYYGSDQDRRSGSSDNRPDYGRDRSRQGERFDNPNVFPGESNNGLSSAARNHGNMGSYGGAQGWGTSRNGSHGSSGNGAQWASGHGREEHQQVNRKIYGAYRDHNSFAKGEREQYDGSGRYGTQGADNTRGWEPADRAGSNGAVHTFGTNDISRRGDDSQYEIYDSAQSNYNRGQYGNNLGGDSYMSSQYGRNAGGGNTGDGNRNEPRRDHYMQQGEGNRSENYGNMAGSLSWGNDQDYRSQEGRERRYDPQSGHVRNQGTQPPSREDFSW